MTIFAKTISILSLGVTLLSVSGLMNTNVEASLYDGYYGRYIVNTNKGVNLRDKNCKQISVAGYGNQLEKTSEPTINCKINGKNYTMVFVNEYNFEGGDGNGEPNGYYVAQNFVSEIIERKTEITTNYYTVNNPNGLNIRNGNCKIVTTVANNTRINIRPSDAFGICKVGNSFYDMTPVEYNGQEVVVASIFLK